MIGIRRPGRIGSGTEAAGRGYLPLVPVAHSAAPDAL
jgi:hypothetical protein